MSKPVFLNIPEACHQDWNQMDPRAKGRFCGSCQKTVVDFMAMSDQQVLDFFKQESGGNTCGRFTNEQLNKSYQEPPSPKSNWYKWVAAFVASGMFGSLKLEAQTIKAGTEKVMSDDGVTKKGEAKMTPEVSDSIIAKNLQPRLLVGSVRISQVKPVYFIEGTVIDDNRVPVSYASITIKGGHSGVSADANGKFRIKVGSS